MQTQQSRTMAARERVGDGISAEQSHRAGATKKAAKGLGLLSLALGASEILAGGTVARLTGVGDRGARPTVVRLMGAREIAAGVGLLTRERSAPWLWFRVAGDALDLALLGRSFFLRRSNGPRLAASMAAVAAVTAVDVAAALAATRAERVEAPANIKAITIAASADAVQTLWERHSRLPPDQVRLRYSPARGGQATEVRVEVLGKLRGHDVMRTLREIKQIVEVGEVTLSDASIHRRPHAARPPKRAPETTANDGRLAEKVVLQ